MSNIKTTPQVVFFLLVSQCVCVHSCQCASRCPCTPRPPTHHPHPSRPNTLCSLPNIVLSELVSFVRAFNQPPSSSECGGAGVGVGGGGAHVAPHVLGSGFVCQFSSRAKTSIENTLPLLEHSFERWRGASAGSLECQRGTGSSATVSSSAGLWWTWEFWNVWTQTSVLATVPITSIAAHSSLF